MSSTVYQIRKRTEGKKPRQLRRMNIVPGVVYGAEYPDSMPIEMDLSEINKLVKENSKSSVIALTGLDKDFNVIVKEVQKDNFTALPTHIDFQTIRAGEVITVSIPIHTHGDDALAYKDLLMQLDLSELEVKGPAEKLPNYIHLDVEKMEFEDRVFVKDLTVPEGVAILEDEDALVGIVISSAQREEEEDEDAEEKAPGEVEVISESKDEE